MTRSFLSPLFLSITLLFLGWYVPPASAQTGPGGVNREEMWFAPTAEDWKKPCLVTFQRTWEDAVAVSRETGKPILVCVNMDGEIASEHYAGVRYRRPETAQLYEPYVCVIASVYRHTPRDHDEQGNRILCPRFGSVTCGEHIAIEPGLYEKFFDETRVAPRHIAVELDGQEMYDVYYAWDTDSVFAAIRDGVADRPQTKAPVVRGDRSIIERVASHDIQDRIAVEAAYLDGDRALKRALLEAAAENIEVGPVDLLRLGMFGLDTELSQVSRHALCQAQSPGAVDLILEALRAPQNAAERDALIGALVRIGETSPRARMLGVVHRGLASRSSAVDVESWSRALELAAGPAPATDDSAIAARLQYQNQVLGTDDANAHLELAEAFLTRALNPEGLTLNPRTEQKQTRILLLDAYNTALDAEKLEATGWRVDLTVALSAYYLGKLEEAYTRAEAAVGAMPSGEQCWNAMAGLGLFAESRWRAIARAARAKQEWPAEWVTDVHSAYTVIEQHPLATDAQVVAHYDFLSAFGAPGQTARILEDGLSRYPDSTLLHDRNRSRILKEHGVAGLESTYEEWLRSNGGRPELEMHAAYTSLVAAEFFRRSSDDEAALAAYDRGIAHYEHASTPDNRELADHFIALALAGRARIDMEQGELTTALAELLASFERSPESAATLDGLGISPVATARTLLARLAAENQPDRAAELQAALDALDPRLLEPPAFERQGPRRGSGGRRGRPERGR